MASRIRVEERRRAVARRVLEIAATATNHDNLLALLATEYGKELELLGNGCSRTVYALPEGLVLKTCHLWSCSNEVEWGAFQRRPDLIVTMYGHFDNDQVDVLIARRAVINADKVWDYDKSTYKGKRALELRDTVHDFHSTNVGFIGNRLMIVDAGNGLFV